MLRLASAPTAQTFSYFEPEPAQQDAHRREAELRQAF